MTPIEDPGSEPVSADALGVESSRSELVRASDAALAPGGALTSGHPGFVSRPGQRELAREIASAIEDSATLVAEAGTGTGKTYAYLAPVLLSAGRTLISTGTRNLQDQLFHRDLPRVRDALGVAPQIALLKGRSNYVCLHHLKANLADGRFARREDVTDLRRIELFARVSRTGDRAELSQVAEDAPAWAMATSTMDNCLGQECPEYGECFLYRARQRAAQADVVVVNHHLFCADLALRDEGVAELLPTTSTLIFDEAHQLPEVATQFFGVRISARQLIELARDVWRIGRADAPDHADWQDLNARMEQAVRELRLHAGPPARLDRAQLRGRAELLAAVQGCIDGLASMAEVLRSAAERSPDLANAMERADGLRRQLERWLGAVRDDDEAGQAREGSKPAEPNGEASVAGSTESSLPETDSTEILWAEVSRSGCTLHVTPLSVADVFSRQRASRARAWIFLSATLAINDSLEHFARPLGLGDARRKILPSPFDFARQALLYVPQQLPDPSRDSFARELVESVWPLLLANGGRAFVLCTTLRMVDRIAQLLAERMESQAPGMLLLRQGRSTRAELLRQFSEAVAPVLVGSASFWEGVDVPGDQLSLVVIDKLPFAPPDDPIVRARSESMRRAGIDPFRALHLPATAMSLKQGAGRLIRSESDRGLLVVGDTRLADKAYGRSLLKSLPPFARTRSAQQALEFLNARTDTSAHPCSAGLAQ